MQNDLRTEAIVLRRTNYGETDRILNILTREGRFSVIAKAARKEKSKLAGGIELFSVSLVVVHFRNSLDSGNKNLGVLTSAKMINFYDGILNDMNRLELGSEILKRVSNVSFSISSPDLFELVVQCFWGLDKGLNLELVDSYFRLNLSKIMGEQINLITDSNGDRLTEKSTYFWDAYEKVLVKCKDDRTNLLNSDCIKLLRLMLSAPLKIISNIENVDHFIPAISTISKTI